MAVTYDLTTDIGKVRLLIHDNDITDAVFTDEEIEYFLTEAVSVTLAASMALEAWAASYAANVSGEKIGDYSYTQKTVDNMLNLAKKYREEDAASPYLTWSEIDLTCGSGITAEED